MIINENLNYILTNYQTLVNNYNKFFYKNICNYSDTNYYEKIYTHGLNIIQNIFNLTSIYLNNISDVNTICEKGYIYFIEFINQLNINNSFETNIELSLKDAILFSYKKTIFNLDKNIKNYSNIELKIFNILNNYIFLINNLNIIINRNIYYININIENKCENNIKNNIEEILSILETNNNNIIKIIKKINNILKFNLTLTRLNEINNIIEKLLIIINEFNIDILNTFKFDLSNCNNKIKNFILNFDKTINCINKTNLLF